MGWTWGQYPTSPPFMGMNIGSTYIVKIYSCIRHDTAVIGLNKINANDNFATVLFMLETVLGKQGK